METFEAMVVSKKFDDENTYEQTSLWNIWYLTPRVFEKEAQDKALQEVKVKAEEEIELAAKPKPRQSHALQDDKER